MKVTKIGLDMDGVIVDKPPLIPKSFLEWLVRSHQTKNLSYRFPSFRLEQIIRWLSHHPFLRPAIKENLAFIKKIAKKKKYQLYLISGRYSFLEDRTWQWLKFHKIDKLFAGVHLNLKNQQPHFFKAKKIKELKINLYIDDDKPLVDHLSACLKKTKIVHLQSPLKKTSRELPL